MKSITTKPKPFCFVLMPFDDAFDDTYELGIKEACNKAGAYCERVDEQLYEGSIVERIYNQIDKADFIIADMTGRNPNVFYEAGYAHALGKRVVLLTKNADDIPFDLKHYPHIVYEGKLTLLRDKLVKQIKWFIEHPRGNVNSDKIAFDIYFDNHNLSSSRVVYEVSQNDNGNYYPNILLHNFSSTSLKPGDFSLGVLTSGDLGCRESIGCEIAFPFKLPNGNVLCMFSEFPCLFPGQYLPFCFRIWGIPAIGKEELLTLRVFTDAGTRDYPLWIRTVE